MAIRGPRWRRRGLSDLGVSRSATLPVELVGEPSLVLPVEVGFATAPPSTSAFDPASPNDPGRFDGLVIGEPGRAAFRHVPKRARDFPFVNGFVVDGFAVYADSELTKRVFDVRAASSRGISHRHEGVVRQDAYAIGQSDDCRFLIAAVADGVSSGRLSHLAATTTVESIVELLTLHLNRRTPDDVDWPRLLDSIVRDRLRPAVRGHLREDDEDGELVSPEGETPAGSPDQAPGVSNPRFLSSVMATTVVIAIVGTAAEADVHPVWIVRLGDTSAWLLDISPEEPETAESEEPRVGRWTPLGDIKNEGQVIAESSTAALPDFRPESIHTCRAELDREHALILMSDGIGDPLGGGEGEVGAELARLWHAPPSPLAFAMQCDFIRKSYDDDRTAVAVWPITGSND